MLDSLAQSWDRASRYAHRLVIAAKPLVDPDPSRTTTLIALFRHVSAANDENSIDPLCRTFIKPSLASSESIDLCQPEMSTV
jgi:hypothetical protein